MNKNIKTHQKRVAEMEKDIRLSEPDQNNYALIFAIISITLAVLGLGLHLGSLIR